MRIHVAIAAAVAGPLAAAPAQAAFDVTAFGVTPSSTAAGAHADVTIAASFPPYDAADPPQRPRTLVFHLPPGLAGDPFATPRCAAPDFTADACPAATRIGTVAASATAVVAPPLVTLPQDVTGDLYNVVPAGSEPARLGAVLRPAGGVLGKFMVATTVTARAADGGLDATVADLPTELGGLQVYTTKLAFTLQGRPAGGSGPFMRNPTSCRPATSTVVATPYGDPATPASKTSSFTPADCGKLAFAPHIAGRVGAPGLTLARAKPPVATVITQGGEQAGQASVAVTLPPVIAPDLAQLARACPVAQAATGTCPESARVGTVEAATPLLRSPLRGKVYLSSSGVGALPGLTIQLADPIPLRLSGAVELTQHGVRTTFTGLPDVPLSRFALELDGGATGIFQLGPDLCGPAPVVTAAFTAQSGAQTSERRPMTVVGCSPDPRVAARIRQLRSGRPVVRVSVAAAAGAPDLTEVRVLFPKRLDVRPRRKRLGARLTTGAGRLPPARYRLRGAGELRATLPKGTRTLTVKLSKGAIRAARSLRRAKHPRRLTLHILVRDGDGLRPARTLKVRPRRR